MKTVNKTLLVINSQSMGQGDESLGSQLLKNYLGLLLQEEMLPNVIALYNSGVQLVSADSPMSQSLQQLEEKGVQIIACKTCLNHFNLLDKQIVGKAGTMLDIVTLQNEAEKVITL